MSTLILAVLAALPLLVLARIPHVRDVLGVEDVEQNDIPPPDKYEDSVRKEYQIRDWVKVTQTAPRIVGVMVGDRVEIECEAFGSPKPTVEWSRGQRALPPRYEESNNIGGVSLGKVMSRLIIDCVQPHHQGIYTCAASSGIESAESHPTTIFVHARNKTLSSNCQEIKHRPRIFQWTSIVMETIGNDAILQCAALGKPAPATYWLDKDEQLIGGEPDSRYKILDSGDLLITKLRWSDMGSYTCVAQNVHGRATETAFLYPILNE